MTIRLVVADDYPVIQEGVRSLAESTPGFEVVGQASTSDAVTALVERLHPEVVVLALMMGGRSTLGVARELAGRSPPTRVLILSGYDSEAYVLEAFRSGARGYALKQAETAELRRAIAAVAAGRRYVSPRLSDRVLEAFSHGAEGPRDPYATLTDRERDVLRLVAEGCTNAAIAVQLGISTRTVESHRARAMRKLDLHTPVELAVYAVRRGIVRHDQ